MTKEELQKLMAGIFVEHQIKVCADRFAAWWTLCEAVPTETARKAYPLLLRKNTYGVPKVAHFMECVKEVQDAENPEKQITESEAWGLINSAVQRFGWSAEAKALEYLEENSPIVAQVARNFGWQSICRWELSQEPTNRAHFWKSLASLQTRKEKYQQLGITDMQTRIEYKPNSKVSSLIGEIAAKMGTGPTQ